MERYRLISGEIQFEEWRDTDTGVERYRRRSGERYRLMRGEIHTEQWREIQTDEWREVQTDQSRDTD